MDRQIALDLTQTFLVTAEELNFRRSAERLHLDPSALSRRIRRLEELLGFALFERTTREVSLTPAGRAFYTDNAGLLDQFERSVAAARRVSQGKAGTLRLGYMAFAATGSMPRAVAAFRAAEPHIDLSIRYAPTQAQKLALAADEIDVGFLIGPFSHSEFHSLTLLRDPLAVVLPRGHPLTRLDAVQAGDLAGLDMVLGDMREWEAYRFRLGELLSAQGVRLEVRLEASTTLAMIGLVAAGIGATLYPASLVPLLGGAVEARPLAGDFFIETVLAWKRLNRTVPVRRFVEVARSASTSPPH